MKRVSTALLLAAVLAAVTRFTIVDVRAGRVVGMARLSKPTVVLR